MKTLKRMIQTYMQRLFVEAVCSFKKDTEGERTNQLQLCLY